jgi:hypothetical protein
MAVVIILSCLSAGPLTVNSDCNKYHLPHIYVLPPNDVLLISPRHVDL